MSTIDSTKPGAFISLTKAAEMLSISVPTLRRRIAAGELPGLPQRSQDHPHPSERPRGHTASSSIGRSVVIGDSICRTVAS
ncbi:MAG: helix-turn-helix domain-containing protein [Actinobacteria bacterium]|nr:helix-turn-helix domain-containing protein [Actinomycetota bacterium]